MPYPEIIDNIELRDRSGGIRLSGTNIEYVRTIQYIVDSGNKSVAPEDILATAGLPIVSITTLSNGAVCTSKDATTFPENPRYWKVVCSFSTQATDQQTPPGQQPSADPQTWLPVWKVGYEKYDFNTVVDATGKKIVNSAGDAFEGSIAAPKTIATFEFSQYEADTITESEICDRNGCVNASDFRTFPKYSLLLEVVGSERGYFNGYRRRKIDYRIKFKKGEDTTVFKEWDEGTTSWITPSKRSGWRFLAFDRGPNTWSGATKAPYTRNGRGAIANLDGSGSAVSSNNPPAVLAFNIYPLKDFATFIRT